ncbi:MAG TPA: baseplate J/gp47 family protein [Pseudoneobacillus sp.]|nr:baseplate J/gp47 family protein [Pseudoneobacillus sp.]
MLTKEEIQEKMFSVMMGDYDKSEGSFMHDATIGVSQGLEDAYIEIDLLNKNISLPEATGDALTELCFQNGTIRKDGESDEQLRERHRQKVITPSQDGNAAQYKEWADSFGGIGATKIFPMWNGGNTVKVAITNSLYQVAEPTLVNAFQNYMDPGITGLGNGVAPIGVKVTVTGGIKKEINITGNVVLAEGYTEPEGVAEAISEYLASIAYVKDSVSYMRTAVAILDTPSIIDMNSFTINGWNVDVTLIDDEIPILNSINLTVVSQ